MRTIATLLVTTVMTITATGCYEESNDYVPQQAQTAPPPQPTPMRSVGQPASSALGKAKQTATNIADRAEQHSRDVANQADEMINPK